MRPPITLSELLEDREQDLEFEYTKRLEAEARIEELEEELDELVTVKSLLGEHPEICLEDRINDLIDAATDAGWRSDIDLIDFLTLAVKRSARHGKTIALLEIEGRALATENRRLRESNVDLWRRLALSAESTDGPREGGK